MLIVYKGSEAVLLPDARLLVEPDTPTEVPDNVAASLLEQPDWRKAPSKKEA